MLISLRATGRRRLAEMVEHVVGLAEHAGRAVAAHRGPRARRAAVAPSWSRSACRAATTANIRVQRALFADGRAVLGRTRVHGAVALKLTLMNPLTTPADVDALLDLVVSEAASPAA